MNNYWDSANSDYKNQQVKGVKKMSILGRSMLTTIEAFKMYTIRICFISTKEYNGLATNLMSEQIYYSM